ncbi:MAG: fatty acid desaturase [Pirellula sp.]|jgi:fatty acid desaturase|nr:fatty acid desaturase [Pirellula sp.]
MELTSLETPKFSIRQAKELVKDLHKPVAWIFWTDFLCTIIAGHACFSLNVNSWRWLDLTSPVSWGIQAGLFVANVLLFLRAAMFTHELVHLPKEGWTAFRVVWNVLCGIPFMIPSFTYYPHIDHHRRKSYGTEEDGEYLNLSHQPPSAIVWYMLGTLVTPFVGLIRWGILTPIAWVFPQVRKWTFARASTMVMDISYVRPEAGEKVYRIMRMQEVACLLVAWFILLHGPVIAKTWLDPFWFYAYAVSVAMIVMNNVRTLGAHRWTGEGSELSFEQQLLDSCDYPDSPWFTELWGPTGTRYHATHHLFPSIPYHNLGKAHRRLMAGLPQDSIFRETVKKSLIAEIASLWKRSAASQRTAPKVSGYRSEGMSQAA